MEHSYELIKTVYQNAEMSKDIIGKLIKICDDPSLRSALADEFAQYHEVICEAETLCAEHGYELKTKKRAKSSIISSISVNTMLNKSTSHIAEMMIQGSMMGVIDMKRSLAEFTGADEKIRGIAEKLMQTELNNAQKMLEFV